MCPWLEHTKKIWENWLIVHKDEKKGDFLVH